MNKKYAMITVLIITYNQEKVIGRALDSILKQREYGLKEIIVSDDCSSDNTWNVVQEYVNRYPLYINANRNISNKGIYANVAKTYAMVGDTDLLTECSGDDIIYDGFFKAIQKCIRENHIDVKCDSAVIYGDFKTVKPNGEESVFHNNALIKYPNVKAVNLRLQHILFNRSSVKTYECFKRYDTFPIDQGVSMAEEFCDIQQTIHSDKNYYIPVIGSVYYSGIGVSTRMGDNKNRKERIDAWIAILKYVTLDKITIHSMLYDINKLKYANKKSVIIFIKTWWHYLHARKKMDLKFLIKEPLKMIFTPYNKIVV